MQTTYAYLHSHFTGCLSNFVKVKKKVKVTFPHLIHSHYPYFIRYYVINNYRNLDISMQIF